MLPTHPSRIGAVSAVRAAFAFAVLVGVSACVVSPVPDYENVARAPSESPGEARRADPQPPSTARSVALVYTDDGSEIADTIADRLNSASYRITRVAVDANDVDAGTLPVAAVAVGLDAAKFARDRWPDRPVVFCDVVNHHDLIDGGTGLWGVQALPPPSLQLRGWKALDPSLERIGVIVGDTESEQVDQLVAAARSVGIDVTIERSTSDRETLYLFRRMSPEIDGFWLLPDSDVLSPGVLRELLSYAVSHDIGVLSFNRALLPWGALLAAESRPDDVAAHVHAVLDRAVAGRTATLATLTPLSEAAVEFNPEVAERLGLTHQSDQGWVLREHD
jgi:ABC-type uncharacterized transport system substrate-binding protein